MHDAAFRNGLKATIGAPASETLTRTTKRKGPGEPSAPFFAARAGSAQGVTGAAHGAKGVVAAMAAQRLAQPADMYVDGAGLDMDVAAPDPVEQLFTAQHPA